MFSRFVACLEVIRRIGKQENRKICLVHGHVYVECFVVSSVIVKENT